MHIYKHLSNTQVLIYLRHVGWGADRLSSHHGGVWDATQILSIFFSGNLGKPGEPAVRQCQVTPRDVPAASWGALWHLGMEQGHLSAPFRSILLTFFFFFFQCCNALTSSLVGKSWNTRQALASPSLPLDAQHNWTSALVAFGHAVCLFVRIIVFSACIVPLTINPEQPGPEFLKRFPEGNVNYLPLPAPRTSSGTYKSRFYFEKCSHLLQLFSLHSEVSKKRIF